MQRRQCVTRSQPVPRGALLFVMVPPLFVMVPMLFLMVPLLFVMV